MPPRCAFRSAESMHLMNTLRRAVHQAGGGGHVSVLSSKGPQMLTIASIDIAAVPSVSITPAACNASQALHNWHAQADSYAQVKVCALFISRAALHMTAYVYMGYQTQEGRLLTSCHCHCPCHCHRRCHFCTENSGALEHIKCCSILISCRVADSIST